MRSWQESAFVLFQVWSRPVTVKSDFGRVWAETVSWATSRGYLTTEVAPWTRDYGNLLKVTQKGLLFLEEILNGVDREDILDILNGKLDQEGCELPSEVRFD